MAHKQTHCKYGHELSGHNAMQYTRDGKQYITCRTCAYARKAASYAKHGKPPRDKSLCKNGHKHTPENTYTQPNGKTLCLDCSRNWKRPFYGVKLKAKEAKIEAAEIEASKPKPPVTTYYMLPPQERTARVAGYMRKGLTRQEAIDVINKTLAKNIKIPPAIPQ